MTNFLLFIYGLAIFYLFLYGIAQLNLLWFYRKQKVVRPIFQKDFLPKVTIQLPIFNERYVVERLLDAISKIDYPKDLLEIQILDDSTDETSTIILNKIAEFKNINFQYIHRTNRAGFKAGALANGTAQANGEFIAIFDADFIPKPSFLNDTLDYFTNKNLGLVQTRWSHLNENYSVLTQIQAFALNAHFTVEQGGRNEGNHCINFNGTAGVWRRVCIEDAGGWQFNSITEDLDLSYRAQMKGWKFQFLEEIDSPAELPVDMNAIRSQQFRWTKGAAECAKMLLPALFLNKKLRFIDKIHGAFHLLNSTGYVLMLVLSMLCYPISITMGLSPVFLILAAVFQVNWLVLLAFYATSFSRFQRFSLLSFLWRFGSFTIFMAGLSLHNGIAVMEGWLGIKTPFIRTPKYNIIQNDATWQANQYVLRQLNPVFWFELLFFVYFCWVIFKAILAGIYGILPFYGMLALGYGSVVFYSIKHALFRKNH